MKHKHWLVFLAVMVVISALVGVYYNPTAFLATTFCIVWAVYHGSKWLRGEPSKSIVEETREAFGKFYGNDEQ